MYRIRFDDWKSSPPWKCLAIYLFVQHYQLRHTCRRRRQRKSPEDKFSKQIWCVRINLCEEFAVIDGYFSLFATTMVRAYFCISAQSLVPMNQIISSNFQRDSCHFFTYWFSALTEIKCNLYTDTLAIGSRQRQKTFIPPQIVPMLMNRLPMNMY